jgi:hypothetical protein
VKKTDEVMEDNESSELNIKRRLDMNQVEEVDNVGLYEEDPNTAMVGVIENSASIVTEKNKTSRTKRSKKDGADSPSLGSAGSFEEPVRAQ